MRTLAASLVLISSVACGPTTKSGSLVQPTATADLTPAKLVATATPGKTAPFRVRVYADEAHRAQILGWERKVDSLFASATVVLSPTAGIELELVETRQWTRKASDMDSMLAELEDLDPGGDVHLVLGLVDALPGVSSTIHQLGVARALGKHIVMRGLNDAKEVEVLEAALGSLPRESRAALYKRRGQHKLTVIFLHELAHALGAIHVGDDTSLLAPTYDSKQASFSQANAELMRVASSFRASAKVAGDRIGELNALAAFLDAKGTDQWIPEERQLVRKAIDERLTGELEKPSSLSELSDDVRPNHRQLYREAVKLGDAGKALEAWEKAETLIDFYPNEPAVAVLACRLAAARRLEAASIRRWCERAAELAPADITPTLMLAVADINAKNVAKAATLLARARQRLLGVSGEHEAAWLKLAEAYQKIGLVSLAHDAAKRSGSDGESVAAWASAQAAKYSVPPLEWPGRGNKFPPSLDGGYVDAVKAALKLVYARNYAAVLKSASAADKTYGRTPGFETVRCDLEIRRRAYKAALGHCQRSLKLLEPASWTNYLTGLLHKQAKRSSAAIKHLERAIELDPTLRHAYEILVGLYDKAGEPGKANALREAFKKRFGSAL